MVAGIPPVSAKNRATTLVVLRDASAVYVRTKLSEPEDVVIPLHIGPDNGEIIFGKTFLVPSETSMVPVEMLEAMWPFHAGFDDAAPWSINGTYIGANHGASDVIQIVSPSHNLEENDLGSIWKDASGCSFYLIEVKAPNVIHLLSENIGIFPRWKFIRSITGQELINQKTGQTLPVQTWELTQLWPACRIRSQQLLADGKPLEKGVPTRCKDFEVEEKYDIIAPDSVLKAVKETLGRKVDFVSDELDSVINNHIVYHFQPGGACELRHRATAMRDFDLGYMGFIQTAPLQAGGRSNLLSYIPKTLPFAVSGTEYDFRGLQDLSERPSDTLNFSFENGNVADPSDLPDRFIQILREEEKQAGFAMGYSRLHGFTEPSRRSTNTSSPLFIHTTRKTYPAAIDQKSGPVRAGEEFECIAYRQYFDPRSHPEATCVYGHRQRGSYILYADFHRPVKRTAISFPEELWGKEFEVIEKTGSIEVLSGNKIPVEGVALTINEERGSIVFRVRSEH